MPHSSRLLCLVCLTAVAFAPAAPLVAGPSNVPRPGTRAYDRYFEQRMKEHREAMKKHKEKLSAFEDEPKTDAERLKKIPASLRPSVKAALTPSPARIQSGSKASTMLMALAKKARSSGDFQVIVPGLSPEQRVNYLHNATSFSTIARKHTHLKSIHESLRGLRQIERETVKQTPDGPVATVTALLVKNGRLYRYEFEFCGEGSQWRLDGWRTTHFVMEYKRLVPAKK